MSKKMTARVRKVSLTTAREMGEIVSCACPCASFASIISSCWSTHVTCSGLRFGRVRFAGQSSLLSRMGGSGALVLGLGESVPVGACKCSVACPGAAASLRLVRYSDHQAPASAIRPRARTKGAAGEPRSSWPMIEPTKLHMAQAIRRTAPLRMRRASVCIARTTWDYLDRTAGSSSRTPRVSV